MRPCGGPRTNGKDTANQAFNTFDAAASTRLDQYTADTSTV